MKEIPRKVFRVDEYGFSSYSGDLEPRIFEMGLRILSKENVCSMGDISVRGDQAKTSENGFFVFYVGYSGTHSTAPDKIHEVPYCPIVDIVEGTTAHEILPAGLFQKLSPEFVGIDLPDGIADPGIVYSPVGDRLFLGAYRDDEDRPAVRGNLIDDWVYAKAVADPVCEFR